MSQNIRAGGYQVSEVFGEKEEKDLADADYDLGAIDLGAAKDNLKNTLYGDFEGGNHEGGLPTGEENLESQEKASEIPQELQENPAYPILEKFGETEGIQVAEVDIKKLLEEINTNIDLSEVNILDAIGESISNVSHSFSNPELGGYLHGYIDHIDALSRDIQTDNPDEVPDEFEQYSFLNNPEDPVVQLLMENYLRIPDLSNGAVDQQASLELAFEVALNKIIDKKQFPRTEAFNLAVKDIKSGTLEERFYALAYVNSLVNTSQGVRGAKSKQSFDMIKARHNKLKESYLEFKLERVKQALENAQDEKDENKIKQLESDILLLEDFIASGDVFEVGELDAHDEQPGNLKEDPLALV